MFVPIGGVSPASSSRETKQEIKLEWLLRFEDFLPSLPREQWKTNSVTFIPENFQTRSMIRREQRQVRDQESLAPFNKSHQR
jgi:hypothetical protein